MTQHIVYDVNARILKLFYVFCYIGSDKSITTEEKEVKIHVAFFVHSLFRIISFEPRQANLCLRAFRHDKL